MVSSQEGNAVAIKKARELGFDDLGKTIKIDDRTEPGILMSIFFGGSEPNQLLQLGVSGDTFRIENFDEEVGIEGPEA